jgi:hypothetical protein
VPDGLWYQFVLITSTGERAAADVPGVLGDPAWFDVWCLSNDGWLVISRSPTSGPPGRQLDAVRLQVKAR